MSAAEHQSAWKARRFGRSAWLLATAVIPTLMANGAVAPTAAADPYPAMASLVDAARSGAPCGVLRYDPQVEQAAEIVNRSTYDYLNHTAENVPADDPHPTAIVADVGVTAGKVQSLQGAGKVDDYAMRGVLVQGHDILTDCSYTDFGASVLREPETGFTLVVVILVGP